MGTTKVNIGSQYHIIEDFGKYFKKGEIWHAWYYGELIFLEVKQDGKAFGSRELKYSAARFIKAIEAGKVREIIKWYPGAEGTNWEAEI